MSHSAKLDRFVAYFETLDRAAVARVPEYYTADAFFKDPFNEVRGIVPIQRVFAHMFEQVDAPRFAVTARFVDGDDAMLTWDFSFGRAPGAPRMLIRGASHVRFAADGRCRHHRDYWDAAEELYEKVPLLGALVRALKRRLQAR